MVITKRLKVGVTIGIHILAVLTIASLSYWIGTQIAPPTSNSQLADSLMGLLLLSLGGFMVYVIGRIILEYYKWVSK
jgi:zinc transporter ZupT